MQFKCAKKSKNYFLNDFKFSPDGKKNKLKKKSLTTKKLSLTTELFKFKNITNMFWFTIKFCIKSLVNGFLHMFNILSIYKKSFLYLIVLKPKLVFKYLWIKVKEKVNVVLMIANK